MKKKSPIFIFIFIFFSFLIFSNSKIHAAESFDINNNSNIGLAQNVKVEYVGMQFTRSRNIDITLNDVDTSNYDDIRICEFADETAGSRIVETCQSGYDYPSDAYTYQITSIELLGEDGIKYIGVEFEESEVWSNIEIKQIILKTTGPEMNLVGNQSILLAKGEEYEDPENPILVGDTYTLEDEIEIIIEGQEVDTSEYGTTHYITYRAIDFLGNTTQIQRRIIIEEDPGLNINVKLIVGIVMGVLFIGSIVYINFWQKKQKEKKKSVLERKRGDFFR